MKKTFYGQRLRFARLYRGKSLNDLAEATGFSKQLLSQYENGDSNPSPEKLFQLVSTLKFPYNYFLEEDRYHPQIGVTYFRSLMSAGKIERVAQAYKLLTIGELYMALQEFIDFPKLNIPSVVFDKPDSAIDDAIHDECMAQIEGCAKEARCFWGLGDEPVKSMQFLMEQNGIIVTGYDTNTDNIDAFTQRPLIDGTPLYIVAVDQGEKSECRIRFDLAHELAHILLHPWSEESESELSKEEFKLQEAQANYFASALLLPAESFKKDASLYPTDLNYYLELKKKWRVSVAAMLYRAHTLKVITTGQYEYMMRQYSKRGWRRAKREPGDTPYFLKDNIFQGSIDLLLNHGVTVSMILKHFSKRGINLPPEEIEELLHLHTGTLAVEEPRGSILKLKPMIPYQGDMNGTSANTEPEES